MKNPSGIIKINQRRVMKNSAVEKERLWMVGLNGAQYLSMNLLELRHASRFVQQVDKACVAVMAKGLAMVGVVGGCGEKQWRWTCCHGQSHCTYEEFL